MSTVVWALTHILFALIVLYSVVYEPLYGVREYRALSASLLEHRGALIRFYRKYLAIEWGAAIAVVLVAVGGATSLPELGLRLPDHAHWSGGFVGDVISPAFMLGILSGVIAVLIFTVIMRRRISRGSQLPGFLETIKALLPVTQRERAYYAALAVTAGICEEIVFRGFLLWYLPTVFGLSVLAAVVVSSLIFGLGHLYQGIWGLVATGLAGAGLAGLYLATDSLLFPIVLHALVDLRLLLLWPAGRDPLRHAAPVPAPPG